MSGHSFDVGRCALCREVLSVLSATETAGGCKGVFAEFARSGIFFALGVSDLPSSKRMEDFSEKENNLNRILGNGNNLSLAGLTF